MLTKASNLTLLAMFALMVYAYRFDQITFTFSVVYWIVTTTHLVVWSAEGACPGRWLCVAGAMLNAIASLANDGRMPAGLATESMRWWQPITESTRAVWLCDVIYGAFSVGDVVIVSGALLALGRWAVGTAEVAESERSEATS